MAWTEDLETVIARTGNTRYRYLTSDQNPDRVARERYRAEMIRMAAEPFEPRPSPRATHAAPAYPPLHVQIGNALTAGLKFLASGCAIVTEQEQQRRLSICRGGCEHYDPARSRCRACGCVDEWKAWLASQQCPKSRW